MDIGFSYIAVFRSLPFVARGNKRRILEFGELFQHTPCDISREFAVFWKLKNWSAVFVGVMGVFEGSFYRGVFWLREINGFFWLASESGGTALRLSRPTRKRRVFLGVTFQKFHVLMFLSNPLFA